VGPQLDQLSAALPSYEIGEEIGRGSTGVVYAARHRRLERQVAIKLLPADSARDESVRRRFVAEAKLLASLSHIHVVPIYDFVEEDGLCLLVMERLGGGTLHDFARAGIDPRASCAAVLALTAGLQHAHERGVLHRDVKPANVLVADDGVVKVTDFGIAKVLGGAESLATRSGFLLGTPRYMAPEQALGLDPSPATDVYGTGAVLYELLAGRGPFEDGQPMQVLYARVHEDPLPLVEAAPDLPPRLSATVMRALSRDRERRQQSAAELGHELDEAAIAAYGAGWARKTAFGEPALGGSGARGRTVSPTISATMDVPTPTGAGSIAPPGDDEPPAPPQQPVSEPDPDGEPSPGRGRLGLVLAGLAALAAVIVVVVLAAGGGDDGGETADTTPSTVDAPVTSGSGWQTLPDADIARQQAPAVDFGSRIWVLGGLTGDAVQGTKSTEFYERVGDNWSAGPDLPVPLNHAMAANYEGRLFVMGGWIAEGSEVDARESNRVYELQGERWVERAPLNSPRVAGAAAAVGDKLVVTGGQAGGELLPTTEVYDGKEWKVVEDIPTEREHLAAVADGRYLYAIGGRQIELTTNLPTLERYDPAENAWESLKPMPEPLSGLGAAIVEATIVTAGGETGTSALGDVFLYDIASDSWRPGKPLKTPRHGLAVVAEGNTVFAIGGATEASHAGSSKVVESLTLKPGKS
jgi:non-specific serine/threonine protein kinase